MPPNFPGFSISPTDPSVREAIQVGPEVSVKVDRVAKKMCIHLAELKLELAQTTPHVPVWQSETARMQMHLQLDGAPVHVSSSCKGCTVLTCARISQAYERRRYT